MDVDYKISNIVLTVSYGDVELDLEEIGSHLENVQYDPEVFPGAYYKSTDPKSAFLIFSSGEMICVGATTVEDAEEAIDGLTDKFQSLGFDVGEREVEVQNMVSAVDFHRKFDLETIARDYPNAEYYPELFPGVVFRMEGSSVVFLLFRQGKGTCVGAKSNEEIRDAIGEIEEIMA